eukprot:COSAG02_NODE_54905_length_293_cov_1.067010_1_plen_96_part_10
MRIHAVIKLMLSLCTISAVHANTPPTSAPCDTLQAYVVSVAKGATPQERWAAAELTSMLHQVVCPPPAAASCRGPPLVEASSTHGKVQLAVGHQAS